MQFGGHPSGGRAAWPIVDAPQGRTRPDDLSTAPAGPAPQLHDDLDASLVGSEDTLMGSPNDSTVQYRVATY